MLDQWLIDGAKAAIQHCKDADDEWAADTVEALLDMADPAHMS
jgi:hypothetical protein